MSGEYAAIYCRISKDRDGRSEGVAVQERRGRAYAAEHWPELPVKVFCDNSITAADPDKVRPEFDRLVAAIRRGEVVQVVAAEQSRLTRQPSEWDALAVTLAKAGIGAAHFYRSAPLQVAGSKLMGRIMAAVDAEEVEKLKVRIHDRLDALAAEGRPAGGCVFGYRRGVDTDGRKVLVVDETQAAAARWAADAVLDGWSLSNIARKLTADEIPTARGGQWTTQTVRSMLTSPTIAGLRVHQEEVTGRGNWEPIIDESTWRRVGAVLSRPTVVRRVDGGDYKVSRSKRPARRYLLTGGVAVCGRCGAPLVAQQRRGRTAGSVPAYMCVRRKGSDVGCNGLGISAEPLEAHVVAELLDEMDRPEFWAAIANDDHEAERAALLDQLAEVDEQRAELGRSYRQKRLKIATVQAASEALDADEAELQAQLGALPAPLHRDIDPAAIRDGWDLMTLDERRAMISEFIDAVVVREAKPGTRKFDPSRVEVVWRRP